MLYLLASNSIHDGHLPLFNLLRYITFRAGCACLTALVISLLMGKPLIAMLRRIQRGGQPIRALGPERHLLEKTGTPTMGGVLILFSLTLSTGVGRFAERVCVGCAADHAGVWRGRLCG